MSKRNVRSSTITKSSGGRGRYSRTQDSDDDSSSDSDVEHLAHDIADKMNAILSTRIDSDPDAETSDEETQADSSVRFVIDKKAEVSTSMNIIHVIEDETESDSEQNSPIAVDKKEKSKSLELQSSLQSDIDTSKMIYLNTDIYAKPQLNNASITQLMLHTKDSDLMKKSLITSDLEKKAQLPTPQSQRQIKKQRKLEKSSTKGPGWFDMKAQVLTEEQKNDLMVIKMRQSLDRKQFYKGNDMKGLPKFFQMGTVVDSPVDFYHSRIPAKQRKQTIVDELLADSEFRRYNKRKYTEIMEKKMTRSHGSYKKRSKHQKKKK